ncbi:MAG TPA: hypothetical protein VGV68_06175 [Terriglobia bacterium]|nr:hypothetical protein [Terriglobia bacterium]
MYYRKTVCAQARDESPGEGNPSHTPWKCSVERLDTSRACGMGMRRRFWVEEFERVATLSAFLSVGIHSATGLSCVGL